MSCEGFNSLLNNGFNFTIERLPNVVFRLVSISLPSINVPAPDEASGAGTQYFPGSATEFDDLQMTFIVDEDLLNYEELYRWITQQRYSEKFVPNSTAEELLVSDGIFITLTNSSNVNRVFKFKDMFPIDIGALQFDTRESNPEPVTCTATFRFSYFSLEPKSV